MATGEAHLGADRSSDRSFEEASRNPGRRFEPPDWVDSSALLDTAFSLAVAAHGDDRRPSDGRLFLEHVTEVAALLHRLAFDEELIATGLLHDSIERGRLSESELRPAMGDSICDLVLTLSEDPSIESLERRKLALRDQVSRSGVRAVTVFAADKLSDIAGLRRQLENSHQGAQQAASAATLASHYRDSVQMIATVWPSSVFLPALRRQLRRLEAVA